MGVREWALERVGEGYIYGARGQICTEAFRKQQAAQYPAQAENILGTGAKWDGKRVWDCAQLVRYAAKQAGVEMVSGATSQWKKTDWEKSGEIATLPEYEIAFLYRQNGEKMQHTGIYLGDGTVVDARGTKNGVLFTDFGDYNWTHWGIPKWQEEQEMLYQATVKADTGSTVNLRKGPGTGYRVVAKVPIGSVVDVYEEGTDWDKVTYNGEAGYMMTKFLEPMEAEEDGESAAAGLLVEENAENVEPEATEDTSVNWDDIMRIYKSLGEALVQYEEERLNG